MSIPGLEKSLHQYTLEPSERPFDMKSVPLATTPMTEQKMGMAVFFLLVKLQNNSVLEINSSFFFSCRNCSSFYQQTAREVGPVTAGHLPG